MPVLLRGCVSGFALLIILALFDSHIFSLFAPPYDTLSHDANGYVFLDPWWKIEYLSPVTLFFVISGFTFVTVYDRDAKSTASPLASWPARKAFFVKRVARLAPVYYAALAIGIVPLIVYGSTLDFALIPASIFMVQAITLVGNGWVGPLWTVSAFVVCYVFFVFTVATIRRWSTSKIAICVIAIPYILQLAFFVVWLHFLGPDFKLHAFPAFRVPQFAIGMGCAYVAKRHTISFPTLLAEACSAILLANIVYCSFHKTYDAYQIYMYYAEFVLAIVHGVWIMCLTQAQKGPSYWVLSSAPQKYLGMISYSLYCTHWPILQWAGFAVAGGIWKVPNRGAVNGTNLFLVFPNWATPILVVICMIVASLLHVVLERPARASIVKKVEEKQMAVTAPAPIEIVLDSGDKETGSE
ncbi:hypothetical protein HDU88_004002 [Geranomyces variabilis]|nr:hypothetical protein HDU88_004002 [Geranomyces variabilis]